MADAIELQQGEVRRLATPPQVSADRAPLVARTDDITGTGEELLVLTPGLKGLKLLPYGSIFHDYISGTNIPVFELPDGTTTDWHLTDEERADLKAAQQKTPEGLDI